jgi:uncharacterized membrane protein
VASAIDFAIVEAFAMIAIVVQVFPRIAIVARAFAIVVQAFAIVVRALAIVVEEVAVEEVVVVELFGRIEDVEVAIDRMGSSSLVALIDRAVVAGVDRTMRSLIDQVVVVGVERKFCC